MDFELWILDSFRIFLRFEISENFSYDNGVVEVSMVKVYIGKAVFIEGTEQRRHIAGLPERGVKFGFCQGHDSKGVRGADHGLLGIQNRGVATGNPFTRRMGCFTLIQRTHIGNSDR